MDTWKLEILKGAQDDLDALAENIRLEAMSLILDLADDPFPADAEEMEGYLDLYKVKFYRGQYRVVFHVSAKKREIHITRVGPRDTVYKGMFPYGKLRR